MPVWQNVQLSVQPTWLEMHSVPRSASGDIDALDFRRLYFVPAFGQPQKPFARTVDGDLFGNHVQPVEGVAGGQPGSEFLGHVGHGVERRRAAGIDPAPQLVNPHAQLPVGNANGGECLFEAVTVHPGKRRQAGSRSGGGLGDVSAGRCGIENENHRDRAFARRVIDWPASVGTPYLATTTPKGKS